MRSRFLTLIRLLAVFGAFALGNPLCAQQLDMTSDKCEQYTEVRKIPVAVVRFLEARYKDKLSMTDNPKRFNASDVIVRRKAYHRLLYKYYSCGSLVVIYYTHGGFGRHNHVVVLANNNGVVSMVKNILAGHELLNDRQVQALVNKDDTELNADKHEKFNLLDF